MRIFNKENGKETVYVQGKDIKVIEKIKIDSPSFDGITKVISDDMFIQFVDPEYVEFFKQQKYIPNYKIMRDLSSTKLNLILDEKKKRRNKMINDFESTPIEERDTREFLIKKITTAYENESIKEYIENIKNKKPLNLPLAIDTDEMQISSHDNNKNPITIGYSLDKKHILFKKNSGEQFTREESISPSLFMNAIMILAVEPEIIINEEDMISCKGTLSTDRRFIMSEELPSIKEDFDYIKTSGKVKEFFKSIPQKITALKTKTTKI